MTVSFEDPKVVICIRVNLPFIDLKIHSLHLWSSDTACARGWFQYTWRFPILAAQLGEEVSQVLLITFVELRVLITAGSHRLGLANLLLIQAHLITTLHLLREPVIQILLSNSG